MSGIYLAAIIATLLSLLLIGGALLQTTPQAYWPLLIVALLAEVPLCAAAFYGVRLPLNQFLVDQLGSDSPVYRWLTTLYAPLTEELAKLCPVALIAWRHRLEARYAVNLAMALGLGFGIGEIWFLAERLTHVPAVAALPWYGLSGFINERFMVCVMHGVFTATAVKRLGRRFPLGLLTAMALHYAGNFPLFLQANNFLGLGPAVWHTISALWVSLYFVLMLLLLAALTTGQASLGRFFFGKATCPDCRTEYSRPFFGINLGLKRYERCPHCKKWHWIRA